MGVRKFSSCVAFSRKTGVVQLFHFFKGKFFLKAICLNLRLFIGKLLWTILFCIPGIGLLIADIGYFDLILPITGNPAFITAMLLSFSIALIVIGLLFSAAFCERYSLAVYIIINEPKIKINQSVKKSIKYTKGRIGNLFTFRISFIFWFISCIFILPALFVIPYYSTTSAIFSEYLIEYNQFYEKLEQ
jgi:uncharacterized membrane protein